MFINRARTQDIILQNFRFLSPKLQFRKFLFVLRYLFLLKAYLCSAIALIRMLERIQYALILLLFVLVGSLSDSSLIDESQCVQAALGKGVATNAYSSVQKYLSAEMDYCDISVREPVVSFDHKTVARQRLAFRNYISEPRLPYGSVFTADGVLHVDAVGYYVFSLRHILI